MRLGRWAGWRTGREPVVVVLHVGYLFVPAGFVVVALSVLAPDLVARGVALHAWTVGAVGAIMLAVIAAPVTAR